MQIKVNKVIPMIVFFPLFTPESLLIIRLFYFISFILSFILFYFIIINFRLFSSSLFFIFNFPRGWYDCFAVCRSLFSPFIFLSSFFLFFTF